MIKALIFAAGATAGFVVGTRAGRKTYMKMKEQSLEMWHSPAVQHKVDVARETVKDKAGDATQSVKNTAPQMPHQVAALAKKVTHRSSTTPDSGTATEIPQTAAVPDNPAMAEPTVPSATDDRPSSGT